MSSLDNLSLALFFTRRTGLCHWDQVGNLEREIAVYRCLTKHLQRVHFITYGGRRDRAYASRIAPIQLHATPSRFPVIASQISLTRAHQSVLRQSDVFKTNQIAGAELAIWAKKKYGKKLIVRCGYLYSHFMEEHTTCRWRIYRAYALEREAFALADAGVVTSERYRQWVIERHRIQPDKMHVIPNYIVTDVFRPVPEVSRTHDLVCVAKASPQKNLAALLRAMHYLKQQGLDTSLMLIGSAAKDPQLHRLAEQMQLNVSYINRVANFDLPAYLNQAKVFVLPSLYEGHPKTLLEAMSCGLPCIGTDVVGIRDDLQHQHTGYLCQADPVSLAEAIRAVLENPSLQQELGSKARRYVTDRYSLEAVLSKELALIQSLFE